MKRVVVGLSGGVDSSVAAHLLVEQGYDVVGLFMRNWNDESVTINNECPWIDDSNDAVAIAEQLGIPFQVLDLSAQYKERIVDYMFAEYAAGRTPNPDVLCNREIKFDVFLKAAMQLGADYVATGHYVRKDSFENDGQSIHQLLSGLDKSKDQSYFLCQLTQYQLSKALFPIGHLQKSEVRAIAAKLGLITAEKKDSQGLCFIGKVRLPEFLQQQLQPKKGKIIEVSRNLEQYVEKEKTTLQDWVEPFVYSESEGEVVGQHNGAHYFTIGQRKGLLVGGKPLPLFVLATDTEKNIIYTGQGEDHPGLYRPGLFIQSSEVHWIREDLRMKEGEEREYDLRIRYRQPLQKATLVCQPDGIYIRFKSRLKSVSPGQFAAWYSEGELIGSGVINR